VQLADGHVLSVVLLALYEDRTGIAIRVFGVAVHAVAEHLVRPKSGPTAEILFICCGGGFQ